MFASVWKLSRCAGLSRSLIDQARNVVRAILRGEEPDEDLHLIFAPG